ncbi:HdeD family acid-resistance protein [Hyphomicrobium methylovorum]|uniref:HdeD family acid-resistance protein n=1 Tax=Hyphomicrobium methylovorum TaxID=84 RepID=UPI0015E641E3|nr:HdeD family acid-resistance protein [Hyphomicrobium methylovorum]MBA2126265.1 HdeD family acid-resistance protein [Hyphomicrobium methylovorum]
MTNRTISETPSQAADPSWWGALLLGVVFIFAGFVVLGDVVASTVISAFLIGILMLVAGISEVFQAFSAQHWRGFMLRLLVGIMYAVCGVILITDPARGSVALTFVFALALIASGIVRIAQSFQYWRWFGGLLLFSGIVGVFAGLVILAKWPVSGLWVLGAVVGVDLVLHGIWWLSLVGRLRRERQVVPA